MFRLLLLFSLLFIFSLNAQLHSPRVTLEALDKDGNSLGEIPTPPEWQAKADQAFKVIDQNGNPYQEIPITQSTETKIINESEEINSNNYATPDDITVDVDDSLDSSVTLNETQSGLLSPVIGVFLFLGLLIAGLGGFAYYVNKLQSHVFKGKNLLKNRKISKKKLERERRNNRIQYTNTLD